MGVIQAGVQDGARKIASAVRAPMVITIAVIALVGGAYYAFYRTQVAYYTGRNLRLISTLSAQIDWRIRMYSSFFRDGNLKPDHPVPKSPAVPPSGVGRAVAARAPLPQA